MIQRRSYQDGYLFESHGAWYVRFRDPALGKQRAHLLCSKRNYPKKTEVKPLAQEFMKTINGTQTVEAGGSVSAFWEVFNTNHVQKLSPSVRNTYPSIWKNYLKNHIGYMRMRDVRTCDAQSCLDQIHKDWGEELAHGYYQLIQSVMKSLFAYGKRKGHAVENPVVGTSIRNFGHNEHRERGAYTLDEIRQFLTLFPSGAVAAAIGVNAFLALRRPEVEALDPSDYDGEMMHIHRGTKVRGQDEHIPVIAPLKRILADWSEPIRMGENVEETITKKLAGTSLRWKGWYAFRRGLSTNLFELGVPPEVACLILRNSEIVCRKHYIRLDAKKKRREAMQTLENAWEKGSCAAVVQQ